MSTPPRNWLCLITNDKEHDNIAEMTADIWTHLDGICAVVHKQGGDDRVRDLLWSRCKGGFVKTADWSWHHGHSMNNWLFDRRISLLDACWIRDSSERFNPAFTASIRGFSASLLDQNIWNIGQHSKLLMFRRWYNQQFVNGLHWGLSGLYGHTISLDQLPAYTDDKTCAFSVRNDKRPFDHRYRHEVLYLLDYAPNGNHLQLFHNDPRELDKAQWTFFAFMQHLAEHNVRGVDELLVYLKAQNTLDSQLKVWLNAERPLRNFYRYYVLNHTNDQILADEDTWRIT